MNPLNLEIQNFGKHGESNISFADFSSALILGKTFGNNRKANGVGKSTIFNAIKYVLFNKVETSTLEGAIRIGADYCKVTFDFFASDNETYRIVRSISRKSGSDITLSKYMNGVWEDRSQRRNSDTEKEITKLIKLNHKTFHNSVLFSQADLTGLASLTPEKRKAALKESLQLDVYSKYEKLAKKQAADLLKDIETERVVIKTIGSPNADVLEFQKELSDIQALLHTKNNELTDLQVNYETQSKLYDIARTKFVTIEQHSLGFATKQKILHDSIDKINESINDYCCKLLSIKNTGKAISDEIKVMEPKILELSTKSFRDKADISSDIDQNTKKIIETKTIINTTRSKLEELNIPLPSGTICKHCRNVISDREACQKLIDIDTLETTRLFNIAKTELVELESHHASLIKEGKIAESSLNDLVCIKSLMKTKTDELESKRSLHLEFSNFLDDSKKRLLDKETELTELNKQHSMNDSHNYSDIKADVNRLRVIQDHLQLLIDNTNKQIISLSNNNAVLSHRISERLKDGEKLTICNRRINDYEKTYTTYQKVIQAFGSAGIPALIIHTILDDFQAESNIWLSKLRPGLQLQFSVTKNRDDGNEVDTLDIGYILDGFDFEYAQLSGSQKLLVALALKLGLASVIKKRLGVELGLLLIDEVDQSLDEESLEALESAVKQLQQEFKVLIITHNNEFKAKFNHAILVEEKDKFISSAKVVTTW